MCDTNIVGRDFVEGELEYSSGSDSVVSELLDQKIWTPKPADYSSSINTGINSMLCTPSDFAIANYGFLYISSSYTTVSRQSGGTTTYWTPVANTNIYNPQGHGTVTYIVNIGSSQNSVVGNTSSCARPAMLYNLASF